MRSNIIHDREGSYKMAQMGGGMIRFVTRVLT